MIAEQLAAFIDEAASQIYASFTERLAYFCALFLDKPYELSPLGEGEQGRFDQSPLMRFDAFDCLTYVNLVLALSFSKNSDEVKTYVLKLNYYDAIPTYINRFHFMSLDWNVQNQKNGFVCDVTNTIRNESGEVIAAHAITEIDKRAWFQKHTTSQFKICDFDDAPKRLQYLHDKANDYAPQLQGLHFLPLEKLFDAKGRPLNFIFNQIKDGCIIEIVRPSWDLREKIGTRLHVSHLGFVFWASGELFFYHASQKEGKVARVLLSDYLHDCLDSPTISGINLQLPSNVTKA